MGPVRDVETVVGQLQPDSTPILLRGHPANVPGPDGIGHDAAGSGLFETEPVGHQPDRHRLVVAFGPLLDRVDDVEQGEIDRQAPALGQPTERAAVLAATDANHRSFDVRQGR